jgi:hypothetical protein
MSKRPSLPAPVPVLAPAADAWELWDLAGAAPRVTQAGLTAPRDSDLPEGTVVLLPARELFTFPLWLSADDESLLPDMLQLQLERRGLSPKAKDLTLSHMVPVWRDNGRHLVRATVLPAKFPPDLCFTNAPRYEPGVDALPMPADSLVFWNELGHIVLAVTRGEIVLHAQSLGSDQFTPDVLIELTCVLTSLEGQNVLGELRQAVLWDAFTPEAIPALERLTGLPVRRQPKPAPRLPGVASGLTPPAVVGARLARTRNAQRRTVIKALVALYACLALAAGAQLAWLKWQETDLTRSLARDQAVVDMATETAQRWKALAPALDPVNYPLEQLLHCAALLPADGVRFTTFQQDTNGILVAGEAQNAPLAFKYNDDLRAAKELAAFTWEMGQPTLVNNVSAKFRIDGKKGGNRARSK